MFFSAQLPKCFFRVESHKFSLSFAFARGTSIQRTHVWRAPFWGHPNWVDLFAGGVLCACVRACVCAFVCGVTLWTLSCTGFCDTSQTSPWFSAKVSLGLDPPPPPKKKYCFHCYFSCSQFECSSSHCSNILTTKSWGERHQSCMNILMTFRTIARRTRVSVLNLARPSKRACFMHVHWKLLETWRF